MQKRIEALRLFGKASVNLILQALLECRLLTAIIILPLAIVFVFALAVLFGVPDNRQAMLQAYPITKPTDGKGGAPKIVVLSGSVIGRGIM